MPGYLAAIALLTLLPWVPPSAASPAAAFHATATGTVTGHGANLTVTVADGWGSVLGSFSGLGIIKATGHGSAAALTLTDAAGAELRLTVATRFDPELHGQVGTFVVVGGTRRFRTATGGGAFVAIVTQLEPVEQVEISLDGRIEL